MGASGSPAVVLVVDDDDGARALIAAALDGSGWELVEASDGADALVLSAGRPPDACVVDLEMPRPNGAETVKVMRRMNGLEKIPIVILTAHSGPEHVVEALEAGASEFVTKPFRPRELRELLARLIDARS